MRVKKDGTGKTNVGPPSFLQLKDIRIYSSKANLPGVTPAMPIELIRDQVFVRLSSSRGQTATSGFVEVYANGEWGTVCDDNWDDKDAAVVCRMLGFSEAGAVATSNAEYGSGHGIISMSNVACQGTEHHLLDCGITRDNWAHHVCSHDEDAGVMCAVDNTVNDFLLFTDSTTGFINRMDLKTYSYVPLQMMAVTKPVALTFNPVDRRLYFSNMHAVPDSQIYSSKLDATGQKLVMHFLQDSEIDGLAVDGHMGKLFYTDAGRKIIASCNLDGSNETIIVDTLLDKPRAIVLDTNNSVMYWTDWGASPKIEKANFDGSGRQVLVSRNIKWPNGLALDKTNDKLYFCDAGTHLIQSVDTSGQNRRVVFSDLSADFVGLAVSKHHLYYSDWNRPSLMRINKDGSDQRPVGPDSFGRIQAIAVSEK